MMSKILLSICIPTYNFGPFIGQTIQSIIDQTVESVEIVILDGGSTDNTREVVEGFQKQHQYIVYHHRDKKGGIDKDMAASVDMARGEYCWLMSSDDVFKPGAIQRILNEIKTGHDIFLCNRTECDLDLNPIKDRMWLFNDIDDRVFYFTTNENAINYFNKAQSIGALFSYMSSIIVRRRQWNAAPYDESFTGSHYAHVFRLFSILQKGGTLKYIKEPLVLCRGDNDSFLKSSQFNRYVIDIDGYLLLASRLFFDDAVRRSFLSVIPREIKWYEFVALKKTVREQDKWKDFESKLFEYGYTHLQLFIVHFINSSKYIYEVFSYCWRILSRIISAVR